MSDYIKREDAIRTMAQYMMDMALIDNPEASDRIEEWEGSIAAPVMSTVKSVDVVEVVRCEDCIHFDDCAKEIDIVNNGEVHITRIMEWCSHGERADT